MARIFRNPHGKLVDKWQKHTRLGKTTWLALKNIGDKSGQSGHFACFFRAFSCHSYHGGFVQDVILAFAANFRGHPATGVTCARRHPCLQDRSYPWCRSRNVAASQLSSMSTVKRPGGMMALLGKLSLASQAVACSPGAGPRALFLK